MPATSVIYKQVCKEFKCILNVPKLCSICAWHSSTLSVRTAVVANTILIFVERQEVVKQNLHADNRHLVFNAVSQKIYTVSKSIHIYRNSKGVARCSHVI